MIPLAMLLIPLPVGLLARSRRQALTITLAVYASLLIVQSIVVASSASDSLPPAYWLVQMLSLGVGLALLHLGLLLRARRSAT